jgi:hypothetical protein
MRLCFRIFGGQLHGNGRIRRNGIGGNQTVHSQYPHSRGLRLSEGIDRAVYLRDFGRDPAVLLREVTARYPAHFTVSDRAVALTPLGMSVSNPLIAECLECL